MHYLIHANAESQRELYLFGFIGSFKGTSDLIGHVDLHFNI